VAGATCGSYSLSAVDRQSGHAVEVAQASRRGYAPNGVAVSFGSVWVTVQSPPQLLRVDPTTREVIGGMTLPAAPWQIASGSDALWVRVTGMLLRVTPE